MTHFRTLLTMLLAILIAACGAGGVSGTRPIVRLPVPTPPAIPGAPGLLALAAGDHVIRVDYTLPGTGFEGALFKSTVRNAVFSGAPIVEVLTGTNMVFTGQTNGVSQFFGFGIRATGTTEWQPIGTTAECQPRPPYYVNPAADPSIANGLTPATAFPDLLDALLVAFINTGGNVWACEGNYSNGPFPIGPSVHLFGGFEPTFDIEQRDLRKITQLNGSTGSFLIDVQTGSLTGILDSIVCNGDNNGGIQTAEGIVISDSNCQLRSVAVVGFSRRGIFVRLGTNVFPPYQSRRIVAIASSASANGLDGCLISNVVADVSIDRCVFSDNFAQGFDCNDLWSMDNNISRLIATGCNFERNFSTGLSADFSLSPDTVTGSGGFEVRIDGCNFLQNGDDGMFLDQQYDGFPQWNTQIRARDCNANGNLLNGIRINADNTGNYLFQRLSCAANHANGLLLNSKNSAAGGVAGEITVSSCWFAGNLLHGLSTGLSAGTGLGNKRVFASQCAFAGNGTGGFTCTQGEGTATNCITLSQGTPFTNVLTQSCFAGSGPSNNPFLVAPDVFAVVIGGSNGSLTLQNPAPFALDGRCELADNGIPLSITSLINNNLVVTPAPESLSPPEMIFGFSGTSVIEDLRLNQNTTATGTGMAAPGQTLDPGPLGAPAGGEPGAYNPLAPPFSRLLTTTPSIGNGVNAGTPIVLNFDRAIDRNQNLGDFIRCLDSLGRLIPASISVTSVPPAINMAVTITPPFSGWTSDFKIELNAGMLSVDGSPFGTPLLLPIHRL
ncbi:MAG: right-handed parallel beta-helix repeat-containing protein [Planctomycetes bacterium]|nr:right-handed parallel beta-helix repeat-containing protein [Planctomycetota bacterium]